MRIVLVVDVSGSTQFPRSNIAKTLVEKIRKMGNIKVTSGTKTETYLVHQVAAYQLVPGGSFLRHPKYFSINPGDIEGE